MLTLETGTENKILRTKSVAVTVFDAELAKLADEMLAAMRVADGIGLAAPQIGKNIRLVVMDFKVGKKKTEPLVLVNPVILERSVAVDESEEGCLSLPKVFDKVVRPAEITVRYQTLTGVEKTITADGINARCIQHEVDHLDGVLFVDRVAPKKSLVMSARELG